MTELARGPKLASWIAQLIAAGIFLQTLYFKFTGAPESVYIFETLGLEPWGRWGTGIAELVAGLLLLVPATAAVGALLGVGILAGAILSHLTELGIEVQGDGGLLFALAVIALLACLVVLVLRRRDLPVVGNRFG